MTFPRFSRALQQLGVHLSAPAAMSLFFSLTPAGGGVPVAALTDPHLGNVPETASSGDLAPRSVGMGRSEQRSLDAVAPVRSLADAFAALPTGTRAQQPFTPGDRGNDGGNNAPDVPRLSQPPVPQLLPPPTAELALGAEARLATPLLLALRRQSERQLRATLRGVSGGVRLA